MDSLLEELDRFRAEEPRAVLATLVATRGTSPRKEGARMWVGERGRILGSVTIGGCVDAHVLHAAESVFVHDGPRLLSIDLGDEDAHAMGLSCAGAVDVLVQLVDLRSGPWLEAMTRLRSPIEAGRRAVTATVLPVAPEPEGRPTQTVDRDRPRASALLVIEEDSTVIGSTGDAGLDARVAERAAARLRVGGAATEEISFPDGEARVFFETHGRGPLLVIVGAGPIAAYLAGFGRALGQYVIVVDGRSRFVDAQLFPEAHEVHAGTPATLLRGMRIDPSSALVLVAHDYKFDLPVLREVLPGNAGYIGMLGSRKRVRSMLEMLEKEGIPPDQLERLHAPIGLDIGGRGAAEIALSICAEIVAVRYGRTGGFMRKVATGSM